jgi:hypothetical protein
MNFLLEWPLHNSRSNIKVQEKTWALQSISKPLVLHWLVWKVVPTRRRKRRRKKRKKRKRRKRVVSLAKRTRAKKRTSRKRKKMDCLDLCLVGRRNKKKFPPSPISLRQMDELPLPLYSVLRNPPNLLGYMVSQLLGYRLLLQDSQTITLVTLYMSNEPFIDLVTLSSPMLVDLCLSKS